MPGYHPQASFVRLTNGLFMFRDLIHAARMLRQSKGWTAVVLLSLALGIGANATLFTAINGVLLQTVPVPDPHALVRLKWYGEA